MIEALVDLAAQIENLYPPDWSDAHVVRFRASRQKDPIVEIRTSRPQQLVLIIHAPADESIGQLGKAIGVAFRKETGNRSRQRCEMTLTSWAQIESREFRDFFNQCIVGFRQF